MNATQFLSSQERRYAVAAAAAAARLADLKADLADQLADIPAVLEDLTSRRYTRPRLGIGYRGAEATVRLDAMLRAERHERYTQPARPAGLKLMNRDQTTAGTGHIPAPTASLEASDVRHSLLSALWAAADLLTGRAWRVGVCPWPRLTGREPTGVLLTGLGRLVADCEHPPTLEEISTVLAGLLERADLAIHGPRRLPVDKPCPYCGRGTLVLELDLADIPALIRCEDDQRTGRRFPCVCNDPTCACRRLPLTVRHEWHRIPTAGRRSFDDLANQIHTTGRAAEEDDQ